MQLVVDEAIVRNDAPLLLVLALAFSTLMLFRVGAELLRGLLTQYASSAISLDMKSKLFYHMMRLPLDWFQKRQIGDIQSKFWALRSIQSFVTQGAITGVLDGTMGVIILALLFLYSPILLFVVLLYLISILLLKIVSYQITKRYAADAIVTDAREQGRFLESLRASHTIKAAGAEVIRSSHFNNVATKSTNAQIRSGNISIGYSSAQGLLYGLTEIAVIYLGARIVMSGGLTVGMLMAFLAYKGQFLARSTNLVDQVFTWRLLDLQLERLADIAHTRCESNLDGGGYREPVAGSIECKSISFRYAFGEPLVIRGLTFSVSPGERLAIVGPSGCGKSTLARLMAGLYQPSGGEVLVDGKSLEHWDKGYIRSVISFVMQDDQLLTGTIAENIGMFASFVDMEKVREAAKLASVHDEIASMPMGYETLVGDMGSSLSGGQKQRVMLARALYREPKILILDEATAHLDIENENAVSA